MEPAADAVLGVNDYHRAVTDEEIARGAHREVVGGLWDEVGRLHLDFLVSRGLRPGHAVAAVGCGALRGGVPLTRYLDAGNYHGLDVNPTLLRAGLKEVADAGLADKRPALLASDRFELSRFGRVFDYGIGVSLFTHLYLNHVTRCLAEVRKVMHPGSRFYFSYFEAPSAVHLDPVTHPPAMVTTYYDRDPFHYAFDDLRAAAARCGLAAVRVGDWGHPRRQLMAEFTPA